MVVSNYHTQQSISLVLENKCPATLLLKQSWKTQQKDKNQ